MRSAPQVLALVGSRPGLIFMVRMIVLSGHATASGAGP